jgi:quinoprotein glucose dehydrogenase
MRRISGHVFLLCVAVLLHGVTFEAQGGATRGEWPNAGGDKGFTRYSSLDQINRDTVTDLGIAWRRPALTDEFRAQNSDVVGRRQAMFQSTPIMVNGVLYASNGVGLVEALDPATGETLWVQELEEEGEGALVGQASRGVAYWRRGTEERILSVRRHYLVATDAKTGKLIRGFGDGGKVDLRYYADAAEPIDSFRWRSAPLVVGDVVVVGSSVQRAGDVRGYDLNSGRLRWTFGVVPGPDDFGGDTWLGDSWQGISAGEADVWSTMSADEDLGLVYLPTSAPTNNMYGGHRPGDNLFSSSIICVRADTGERVWHFQTVHHDIFDYDNPTPPILTDITVDGRPIKALVQLTKQGIAFVLDRETGEPVWPIEERPVPESSVPGEWTAPTQPFPTRPAPYEQLGITTDDLIDFTPELRAEAVEIAKQYVLGPLYTPPSLGGDGPNEMKGTLSVPGHVGGSNWGGGGVDPETGMLYAPSRTGAFFIRLSPGPGDPGTQAYRGTRGPVVGPRGLPLTKPPYGRITAISLNTGDHVWMVPNGDGPRDHPDLQDLNLPPLGQPGHGMILVTKTLLFVSEGDPSMILTPPGSGASAGRMLRAFDKATGAVVWESEFPAGTTGALMTYLHNGTQYIVMPISSPTHPAEWVALRLL